MAEKEKKQLTPEQIYKRNQLKAKIFDRIAPICFWVFLALSIMCLYFAVKNSFGNVGEILALLDSDKYTGIQLEENYTYLTEKYGEWVIGTGGAGFTITFVNIGNAVFSGVMVANCILAVFFFVAAFVAGKWLLPKLAKQITQDNQDMVNMTILKQAKGE